MIHNLVPISKTSKHKRDVHFPRISYPLVHYSYRSMKIFLVVAFSVVICSCAPVDEEWESWKTFYNKEYTTQEEELWRHVIWQSNKKYVEKHNSQKLGYTLKLNIFGDMVNICL